MGKNRNISEDGHIVPLFLPADQNGAIHSSLVVAMKEYSHASILIYIGAASRAAGIITLESCDDATPTTSTEIVFNYYESVIAFGSANTDVLSVKKTAAVTGIVPPAGTTGVMYVIELDAIELTPGHIGFRISIADPGAASIIFGAAILSGAKHKGPASVTALA